MEEDKQTVDFRNLSYKIVKMFERMREVSEHELMAFTADELKTLKLFYGDELTYPIHGDIDYVLSGPSESERVH